MWLNTGEAAQTSPNKAGAATPVVLTSAGPEEDEEEAGSVPIPRPSSDRRGEGTPVPHRVPEPRGRQSDSETNPRV